MFSTNESVVCDESSMDSNCSMTNSECSDNLDMLYLLASVAEKVSCERLHALAAAAACLKETRKSDVQMLPPAEKCEPEKRLFRHECPFCCRRFSRKENLKCHIRKHIQENPEESSESQNPLPDPVRLTSGQTENNLISAVPDSCGFWCVKCEKNFQREATFRVHMRFHARKRAPFSLPLPCKKCAELCTTKTQYLIHKKMHRMEKIFRRRGFLPEPVVL